MKPEKPPVADRESYYAEAASWSQDVHGSLRRSRRIAWIVAGVAAGIALLEAIALAALAPLKTVIPYTVTVDRQTGYVETIQGLKAGPLTQDAALTQSMLARYVLARETFDASDLQANYRMVTSWSQGPARARYIQQMAASNPQSPVRTLPSTTVLRTTVKSISLLSPTSALVRFETERLDGAALAGERRSYAAVIGYRFTGAPMRMEDRLLNPLGFQVTAYRRDAESLGAVPAPPPGAS